MKKLIFVLLLSFLLSACSTSFETTRIVDEKTNSIVVLSSPIKIHGLSQFDQFELYISFISQQYKNKEDQYFFSIKYLGYQFPKMDYMKLDIDGIIYESAPDRVPIFKQDGVVGYSEEVYFPVNRNIIEDILELNRTRMTIKGYLIDVEIDWKGNWIDYLKEFYIDAAKKS
ncbi:MAG: hypothetical protein J5I57_07390 [Melioribacteraceae bacterium]|nr:hypothetical protein [Melioribacteraceae bacterium]